MSRYSACLLKEVGPICLLGLYSTRAGTPAVPSFQRRKNANLGGKTGLGTSEVP